jgi:hypothetical protein
MTFMRLQSVVGMYVGNGDAMAPVSAHMYAYDGSGTYLGSVALTVDSNDVRKVWGIRSSEANIARPARPGPASASSRPTA